MKRFIINLIVSLTVIFIVHLTLFDNAYTFESISNAFFVVGLMLFFFSLMLITNASNIFLILNYSFKTMFNKVDKKYRSFYDYSIDKKKMGRTQTTVQVFIISITYIVISLILAQFA